MKDKQPDRQNDHDDAGRAPSEIEERTEKLEACAGVDFEGKPDRDGGNSVHPTGVRRTRYLNRLSIHQSHSTAPER